MSSLSFNTVTQIPEQIPLNLKLPFQVSVLISSFLTLTLLVLYFRLQPTVPFFYSLAEPNDYLAPKMWLIFFPTFSFFITIFHLVLIRSLYQHERIIPKMFAWSTVVMQVLLALAFIRIIVIIT